MMNVFCLYSKKAVVGEHKEEEEAPEYVPFWKPNVTINLVDDSTRFVICLEVVGMFIV